MPAHTILIIDDDPDFMELTRARLEATGYRILTAENGPEGIRKAKADKPDAILLDVVMPGMDGGDVGQAFAADPHVSAIPVIHFTTLVTASEAVQRNRGAAEELFVSKTSPTAELLATISSVLERREHTE